MTLRTAIQRCLFLALILPLQNSESLAQTKPSEDAIIFGMPVDPHNSPIVEVLIRFGSSELASCSGTVIGKRTILTAGHCVSSIRAANVIFGEGAKVISGRSWWRDPEYKELRDGTIINDLGIIRLSRDIPTGTPRVAVSAKALRRGNNFFIYGYGLTEDDTSDELRVGIMRASFVTGTEITAFLQEGGSLTCNGDSGGPAIVLTGGRNASIVGVTSTGDVGCRFSSNFATVASAHSRSFIKKYLQ